MKNNQDNSFNEYILTKLDSFSNIRNTTSDNELAINKSVVDSLGSDNNLRFNQTLENYLKVSVENDVFNLT